MGEPLRLEPFLAGDEAAGPSKKVDKYGFVQVEASDAEDLDVHSVTSSPGPKSVTSVHSVPDSVCSSPPRWTKAGEQKNRVLFRRAFRKRPAAAKKPAAAESAEPTAPVKKPAAAESAEPTAPKRKASFSVEGTRNQVMCRYGIGAGSTHMIKYEADNESAKAEAIELAKKWCAQKQSE